MENHIPPTACTASIREKIGWLVTQLWIFENVVSTIEAKPIRATIKPESHYGEHAAVNHLLALLQLRPKSASRFVFHHKHNHFVKKASAA